MKSQKVALIEIGGSHDECLYSQLLFLKSGGYNITLICSENLRAQVEAFGIADETLFFDFRDANFFRKTKLFNSITQHIRQNGIETVILNTAQSSLARSLVLQLPAGVQILGTLHSLEKLQNSFTQLIINLRVKKYFLLNDYLVVNAHRTTAKGLKFSSYYPIFFPNFGYVDLDKRTDEVWIVIPGQVEYKRRDYETLVNTFALLNPKPNYKFILLGKSTHSHGNGRELRRLLLESGIEKHFILWDKFVDNKTFHAYLKECDIVMPLIHPGNEGFEQYRNSQISGAYNLAFAYKKPLLMLNELCKYEDFKENGIFYTLQSFNDILPGLPQLIEAKKPTLYKSPKWNFETQAAKYLSFIKD